MASERTDPREEVGAETARDRAAGGAALLGGRGAIVYALAIVANIALARLLSPRDFGLVALGTVLLALGGYLSDGGMGYALVRRKEPPDRLDLEAVSGVQLALATAIAAVAAGGAVAFGRDGLVVALMLVALPITTARLPAAIVLERRLLYRPVALVDLVEAISYYAWALVAVALGLGVWGLASAVVARAVIGVVLMARVGPVGFVRPRWAWQRVRPVFGFGAKVQAGALVNVARDQALNVAVAVVAGVATLGVWSLAYRVLQVPQLVIVTAVRVMFPLTSRAVREAEDVRPLIERGVAMLTVAVGAIVTAMAAIAPAALPALLGPEWGDVPATLLWAGLALALTAPAIAMTIGYLYAVDRAGTVAVAVGVQAVIWVALTVALLPSLDTVAVGVAAGPASVVAAVIMERVARALSGAAILKSLIGPVIASVTALTVGWFVARAGPESIAWGVAAVAVAEVTLVAGLALLARAALTDAVVLAARGYREGLARGR